MNAKVPGDLPVWRHAAGLTGRRAECGMLDRLVEAVRAGQSQTLVVHGESGVGKTALLEYLAARASACRVAMALLVSSPRWSWPSPGCISCACRCWTAWRRCRGRSMMRCGPRSG